MAWSQKLHNPTPWKAEIPWDRGQTLVIPAGGSLLLSARQMEDFLPSQPGAEQIEMTLNTVGVFLEDSDRDYDAQARDSLKKCIRAKSFRFNEAVERLQSNHIVQGLESNIESEAFQRKLGGMGLLRIKREIEELEKMVGEYEAVVGVERVESAPRLDPTRTIFAMDPPREFPSKTSMGIFLKQNPEVAKAHEEFLARAAEEVEEEAL